MADFFIQEKNDFYAICQNIIWLSIVISLSKLLLDEYFTLSK